MQKSHRQKKDRLASVFENIGIHELLDSLDLRYCDNDKRKSYHKCNA